ncbi:acidic leucine-rich nuclear phosphoprotein 32 family member B-like [Paramacrobiotus metropolitanus]|uniref:acidic leucine-rich nuclear phosphoprotein 32 family member B-like n=1 Tax=Paramacrobiotus metropolitanus TaxID=2943436 RepID=UPI00244625CC|nr:acidic leucine-rich nuclear phosphoprotein 32 family member B-like [Paramacrobiotus metropolitanus]
MSKIPDIKERIQKQAKDRKPADVLDLNLDNCKAECLADNDVTQILEQYFNLEELSLINIGLTSLRGFPKLPKLRKLDLSDNRLTGGLNHLASTCPSLEKLLMGGNRLKQLDALEPLKALSALRVLDMCSCPIADVDDYKLKVFEYLFQLTDLDGLDRNGQESRESDDEDSQEDGDDYSDTESENGENVGAGEDGEDDGDDAGDSEMAEEDGEESMGDESNEAAGEPSGARKGLKRKNDNDEEKNGA